METLDLEAPGRSKASVSDRLKALWASVRGNAGPAFKPLAQDDAPDMEAVFREAGMDDVPHMHDELGSKFFFGKQKCSHPTHQTS